MHGRWTSRGLFFALAALVMVAACETVPYTGRSQLQLISAEQETQMGAQTYTQTLAKEKLSTDPVATEMVKRVGSRIAAVTGLNYQWEYRLIQNDKTVNAFALPGGKVAVYTGMLPVTRDENGLAAVLGHEIGHVVARHGGERVSQQLLVNVGVESTMAALSIGNPATVQAVGSLLSGSSGADPDGEGGVRPACRSRSVGAHGPAKGREPARVPFDPPVGSDPRPPDRRLAPGSPPVL